MSTLCLAMVVQDAALVLDHCLDSVLPHVHTWVILDTGSTDGTQDIIRRRLGHLPGEMIEAPWLERDAAHAQVLEQVGRRADYILLLDAEDILLCPTGYAFPPLTAEGYSMSYRTTAKEPCPGNHRVNLVSAALPWRDEDDLLSRAVPLEEPIVLAPCGHCGNDPRACRGRIRLLEQALRDDPHNGRLQFLLATHYRRSGKLEEALATFQRRASAGARDEEGWAALVEAARTLESLGRPDTEVVQGYLAAYERLPERVEPLQHLARFLWARGALHTAGLFAALAGALPPGPCGSRDRNVISR